VELNAQEDDAQHRPRPRRADARRNAEAILIAADAVFAVKGPSASTEEIAHQADVAIGTVFRHFPTKAALVEAVFVGRLQQLSDTAQALAADEDPGHAFFEFFGHWAELSAVKLTFADALSADGVDVDASAARGAYPRVRSELMSAVETLLARGQAAGALRDDIGIAEVNAILIGAARAAEHTGEDPAVRARTMRIVVDGLRPRPTQLTDHGYHRPADPDSRLGAD
jgi:AcrR family transcriptional regulator